MKRIRSNLIFPRMKRFIFPVLILFTVAMASSGFNLDPMTIKNVVDIVKTIVNENGQVTVRGRTIKYKAEGRVHSFKEPWVYDGTAWDLESGISEKAKHYKSKQGAIEHAMLKLLERLKRDGILPDLKSEL